jgi:signal transduction histidine kinase
MELVLLIVSILLLAGVAISFYFARRHYKKLLKIAYLRARKSEQLKSVFIDNVSRTLRSPLNAISKYSDFILEEKDENMQPELIKEMATNISKNTQQLLSFVSKLVELSRFEGITPSFTFIEVNLTELMASYRREAQRDAGANVQVVVRSPLSPHCKGTLDTNLMYQLMTHLLHNALVHTQEGTVTIDYDYEENGLRIEVIDTGDGEPQDFQSGLSALTSGGELALFNQRSGLGLSICKSIVEGLHGTIDLKSEKGKGTHVVVWIPCKMRDMKKGLVK